MKNDLVIQCTFDGDEELQEIILQSFVLFLERALSEHRSLAA